MTCVPRGRGDAVGCRVVGALLLIQAALAQGQARDPLHVVVMDPLSAPLSCPCVEGYAQRQYEKLGEYLGGALGREVHVFFDESLPVALEEQAGGRVDLVIGKDSVVRFDGRRLDMPLVPLAALTDKRGETTQAGLIVVRFDDPARTVSDLAGYRIVFGPEECEEKHAAALELLRRAGVEPPAPLETAAACSVGVSVILELEEEDRAAAVISSYAEPLLEGCGTVPAGALRVVGETAPVPFVTAFAPASLPVEEREALQRALLDVKRSPALWIHLETRRGFVPLPDPPPARAAPVEWTGFRGPQRDGRVPWLPDALSKQPRVLWEEPLSSSGLGGIAATATHVVLSDRDLRDLMDVYRCLDAETGEQLWQRLVPASGELDFGNSPRATPLIDGDRVYLYGAFGHLACLELATGKPVWRRNVFRDFDVEDASVWGAASSPLVVDGKLIVNPGGAEASLVALDALTGEEVWRAPGPPAAFASFVVATFSGVRQLVGYDRESLGGWDIETGRRLWMLKPEHDHDFNVPTPIPVGERLLVTTENNGTRLYAFDAEGRVRESAVARHDDLAPDISTPVVVGSRVFGCWHGLYCLDLENGLETVWHSDDEAYARCATLLASPKRVLVLNLAGELLLVDATADGYRLLSRTPLFDEQLELYAHPAVVGDRLYVRGATSVKCVLLGDQGM